MDWADKVEKPSGEYFKIAEGDNRIQLLSHCAPYALKWTGAKYEPAEEGDTNVSWKGVCWVLQDGVIKSATLPYTVVKAIKGFMEDEDYAFSEFPMPRQVNIKAVGAGTKEVEYNVIPSPKEAPVAPQTLTELAQKPTPEEMVEKMRKVEKVSPEINPMTDIEQDIKPEDIPF